MEYPSYSLTAFNKKHIYEFDSIGNKQVIKKLIIFAPIKDQPDTYNLSFGDKNENLNNNRLIDDTITSNNGDMKMVLATVFRAVIYFVQNKKNCKIYFKGSTNSRTRLYRMAITNNYKELSKYFVIWSYTKWNFCIL